MRNAPSADIRRRPWKFRGGNRNQQSAGQQPKRKRRQCQRECPNRRIQQPNLLDRSADHCLRRDNGSRIFQKNLSAALNSDFFFLILHLKRRLEKLSEAPFLCRLFRVLTFYNSAQRFSKKKPRRLRNDFPQAAAHAGRGCFPQAIFLLSLAPPVPANRFCPAPALEPSPVYCKILKTHQRQSDQIPPIPQVFSQAGGR